MLAGAVAEQWVAVLGTCHLVGVERIRRGCPQRLWAEPRPLEQRPDRTEVHGLTVVGGAHHRDLAVGERLLADRRQRDGRLQRLGARPDEHLAIGVTGTRDEPAVDVADGDVTAMHRFLEP